MRAVLGVVALLSLYALVCLAAPDVKIVTTHTPEECVIKAKVGDTVRVHYVGRLTDETIFDSSLQEGREPLEFELGSGRVIPGWEKGIAGMCIGERRTLTIPPELAYGDQAVGPIPAGSTLIFETQLVDIPKFGAGGPAGAQDTTAGGISKSSIGFLLIIAGFFAIVFYLVTAKPELGASGGQRRSSKSGSKSGRRK